MNKAIWAAVLASLSLSAVSSAAVILVDDFSSASAAYPLTSTNVPGVVTSGADNSAGAIGGVREVVAELSAIALPGLDNLTVGVFPISSGVFDYATTSGANGLARLLYGGNGSGPSLNLAVPDGSTLDLDVLLYDLPAGGSLTITATLNNVALSGSVSAMVNTAGPQIVSIPLDSISSAVRSNVTGITLKLDGTTAVDFRLDDVVVVIPEPSALGLLAPAGLLLARRRK